MSLPSADHVKWQKWLKRQDWLVIEAEMAWNVMIRNDIDLAMTWHDGKSGALSLALWLSLSLSGPLSCSLALSLSLALAIAIAFTLALLLTLSCSHAFSLSRCLAFLLSCSFALSLLRSCSLYLSLFLSYFTRYHFCDEETKTFPWNGGKKYWLTPVDEMKSFMILAFVSLLIRKIKNFIWFTHVYAIF